MCIVVIKWGRTRGAGVDRWTCKTAEYCAIYSDHPQMVAWALLRGVAVNNETILFCTLLQALVAQGQRDIVPALLKRDVGSNTLLPKLPLW